MIRFYAFPALAVIAALASIWAGSAVSAPFLPGSLLVTQEQALLEVSRSGALIQSTNVPQAPAQCTACEQTRDVVTSDFDHAYVYNGTFDPHMSTYNAAAGTWSHKTFVGISTAANVSYGGIAIKNNFVFMTDMDTGTGDDELKGIVRFDLDGGPTTRFAKDFEPIDLSIGLDGYLYALANSQIRVFDPVSMSPIKTVSLNLLDDRAVAVDHDGTMFVLSYSSTLYRFDATGVLVGSRTLPNAFNTIDVDIAQDGTIAVGDRFGTVVITDRTFSSAISFSIGNEPAFVGFVPVPEPSGAVVGLGLLTGLIHSRGSRIRCGAA